jgi:hypothetical protein
MKLSIEMMISKLVDIKQERIQVELADRDE